jgi:hypothetical protein
MAVLLKGACPYLSNTFENVKYHFAPWIEFSVAIATENPRFGVIRRKRA